MIDASIPLQAKTIDLAGIMHDAQAYRMRDMQMQQMQRQQQRDQQLSDLLPRAVQGDQAALQGVASTDPDTYMKVRAFLAKSGDATGELAKKKFGAAGPLLVRMKAMPYEQRKAFIQQAAPVLMANGWTPEELAQFDPSDQAIDALGTTMMTIGQVLDSQKISWHPIGEQGAFATDAMGNPTGAGNPFAGGAAPAPQGSSGPRMVSSPEEARRLPPGTPFRTPDGRIMRVPGGGSGNAAGGFRP
jgi:hypothetical protein